METVRTRPVEVILCWDDHTWDTRVIEIPADTEEDELYDAVTHYWLDSSWDNNPPVYCGLYNSMDEKIPDEDADEEEA